ncbi:MAG: hypothetical protein RQ729_00235 [Wenzhouxiangellaceae bacterium]|nr:hypothetical protein [Wenzhouxiangellaceae bacterium]
MRDRLLLLAWLAAVVAATLVHAPLLLGSALGLVLVVVFAIEGRAAGGIVKRALLAVVLVNLAVSLGFIASAIYTAQPWLVFVTRLNLRVLLIAILTLAMSRHLRLEQALDFHAPSRRLAALIQSQVRVLQSVARDLSDAFASRNPVAVGWSARFRHAGHQAGALMDKTEAQATRLNEGMRSRGYFDSAQ